MTRVKVVIDDDGYPSLAGTGYFTWGGKAIGVRLGRPGSEQPIELEVAFATVLAMTAKQAELLGLELIEVARASRAGESWPVDGQSSPTKTAETRRHLMGGES